MAKEKVIVFEGEHMFVSPKNHVVDKKTGITYQVPSEMNLVSPQEGTLIEPPVKPLMQPDEPPIVTTTTTEGTIATRGGSAPLGGAGSLTSPLPSLGDPTALVKPPEESVIQQPTQSKVDVPTLPISFGAAPPKSGVSGGGGGGGSKEEAKKPKASFLSKYWWVLAVIGVGGYLYYKRKK